MIKIRKLSDKMKKISEIKIKLTTQKINVILPVSQNQLAITNQRGEKVDEEKDGIFNNNPELFQVLLNEYKEIRVNLEKELTETGKSKLYTDLTKLIVKIADYIFSKEEDVRKGIGEIMGEKVQELESERLQGERQ